MSSFIHIFLINKIKSCISEKKLIPDFHSIYFKDPIISGNKKLMAINKYNLVVFECKGVELCLS